MTAFDFEPNAWAFSRKNAYWLGRAAKLAYDWPANARAEFGRWGLSDFQAFDVHETQVFIAGNAEALIVAFRGTEQKLRDWMTDFDVLLVGGPGGRVHQGFQTGLSFVWRDVSQYLRQNRKGRALWVTGHSLGGALATVAVARLRLELDEPVNGLYTYGQPRVGDRDFARTFDADFGDQAFRYVNNNDVVPRVPLRAMEYSHIGTFKYFDRDGNENDQISWFDKIVDRMTDRIDSLLKPGTEGIEDHDMMRYLAGLERAKNR
jgi:triacylglycerol lipase